MGRSLILDIEGEMDPATPLADATDLGRQIEDAVHGAVSEARQVRWIPTATPTGSPR
jgi:hypothetical protein